LAVLSEALSPPLSETLKSEKDEKIRKIVHTDGHFRQWLTWRGRNTAPSPYPGYWRTLKLQTLGWLPAVFGSWSSWLPARSLALVITVAT
jgi:hypothetical protein